MVQPISHEAIRFEDLLSKPGVVEELEIRSSFGFCAFHGGNLERVTDDVARKAAATSGSSYYGVLQPPGMRHHIPSAKVDPEQSAALSRFLDHCDVIVAIHGYGRMNQWTTLHLGGQNRRLAGHVAHHLRWRLPAYRVLDKLSEIPKELRGQHQKNPCNLPTFAGVQVELPPRVRGLSPLALHWPGHDWETSPFPHTTDLVAGLANAATTWPSHQT